MAQGNPMVKRVFAMGRGKSKEHGDPKDRYFLGMPQGRTIILEDVTTTGDSLLHTLDQLVGAHVEVVAAITLTDRNQKRDDGKSISQVLAERGIPFYAMSNALELLPQAYDYEEIKPDAAIARAIEQEFREQGISLNMIK